MVIGREKILHPYVKAEQELKVKYSKTATAYIALLHLYYVHVQTAM